MSTTTKKHKTEEPLPDAKNPKRRATVDSSVTIIAQSVLGASANTVASEVALSPVLNPSVNWTTASDLPIQFILGEVVPFLTVEDMAALVSTSKNFSPVQVVLNKFHKQIIMDRKSWPIDIVVQDASDPNGIRRGVRRVTNVRHPAQILTMPGLTHVTLRVPYYAGELRAGNLHPALTHLDMGRLYSHACRADTLPPGLISLRLGGYTNQIIDLNNTKLVKLVFGENYTSKLEPGSLPDSLRHLTFGAEFDNRLEPGVFPPGLTHLTFGYKFNKKLEPGVLPPGLTHLTFGYGYEQMLEPGVLPPGLTHLYINDNNYNIGTIGNGTLPPSLTHLVFGGVFTIPPLRRDGLLDITLYTDNHSYQGTIPTDLPALRYLWLGARFVLPIDFDTLPSLEVLVDNSDTGPMTRVWSDSVDMYWQNVYRNKLTPPAHVRHYQYPPPRAYQDHQSSDFDMD